MSQPSAPPEFLISALGITPLNPLITTCPSHRPHVTLTFAQSLDGKIAAQRGKQLILSGWESMVMTHWMRTAHDAILIGIGTALNDDPQLNTRHLPQISGHVYHLPRPVVLDHTLRSSPTSKLLTNYREGRGRRPWILTAPPSRSSPDFPSWQARKVALEEAGAAVLALPSAPEHEPDLLAVPAVLLALRERGVRSVMVEGGARVIASFLAAAASSSKGKSSAAVDTVIVTVAPVFVGEDGVGYGAGLNGELMPSLEHVHTEVMGRDSVVVMKAAAA